MSKEEVRILVKRRSGYESKHKRKYTSTSVNVAQNKTHRRVELKEVGDSSYYFCLLPSSVGDTSLPAHLRPRDIYGDRPLLAPESGSLVRRHRSEHQGLTEGLTSTHESVARMLLDRRQ